MHGSVDSGFRAPDRVGASLYERGLRGEGGGGESVGVVEEAGHDAAPAVANVYRLVKCPGGDENGIAVDACVCGKEVMVWSGYLESAGGAVGGEAVGVIEPDAQGG